MPDQEAILATQNTFSSLKLLPGFIGGFIATLSFHQVTLALLWRLGIAPFAAFSFAPTQPFGVPALFSLAFWGGAWGIPFAIFEGRFPRNGYYWLAAFLFGAILPSLVALLVVLPLKGHPIFGGWQPMLLVTAVLINGAWGVGTCLFLKMFSPRR